MGFPEMDTGVACLARDKYYTRGAADVDEDLVPDGVEAASPPASGRPGPGGRPTGSRGLARRSDAGLGPLPRARTRARPGFSGTIPGRLAGARRLAPRQGRPRRARNGRRDAGRERPRRPRRTDRAFGTSLARARVEQLRTGVSTYPQIPQTPKPHGLTRLQGRGAQRSRSCNAPRSMGSKLSRRTRARSESPRRTQGSCEVIRP